jgi:glycosyltransferase involved in cell wall biosynthesis
MIANEYGTPVATIPCGVKLPLLVDPKSERYDLRSAARLVWIGRADDRQKRVSDLPAIVEELSALGVRFRLDIIGDGYDLPLIRRGLSRATAPHVHFHGWLPSEAVNPMLSVADVLLLPSNFEGMPVVAMEALAHGCAVVASNASGLDEYDGRADTRACVWIHEVGDTVSAARAVQSALSSTREARRAQARQFAAAEFAIATCMGRYASLLSGLVPRQRLPPVRPPSWLASRIVASGIAAARRGRRWLATSFAGVSAGANGSDDMPREGRAARLV